jgi:hypothetical protein
MSNIESIHQFSDNLKTNNDLQIELAKIMSNNSDFSDNDVVEWVIKYSAKFRELILKKSTENPSFWSEVENLDMRKEILNELKTELEFYEEDSSEKLAA